MENRVVITGLGIWSSIGTSLGEVTESLREGRSGIGLDPERRELGYISALTGIVKRPELKGALDRRKRLCLPQQGEYAYMATAEAMRNAGMDEAFLAANEVGIIYGNDSSAAPVIEGIDIIRAKRNTAMVGSGNIFQSMNSTVTMNLACLFHLRGINLTASAACASGSHAVGLAYLLVRNGMQDCVVCGGAQEANLYGVASFDGIQSFSVREDEPEKASRPFDRDRDGLVPGGGAATVVVEGYEHALKRGAPILCEIVGWGFSGNGDHISTPNVAGPARSLELCLQHAGVTPSQIGYINAHATSTRIGDSREAQAIAQVFGDYKVPVTSTKSQTGHEMWMAGASELIYSTLMMKNGFIAGNINFEHPDEDTACLNIIPQTREAHFDMFLSNSFGFGGTNSTLIVKNI